MGATSDEIIKETCYYADAWYKVEYQNTDTQLDFKAYKITGLYDDEGLLHLSEVEENPSVTGYLKWDGCMEFEQDEHYCSLDHAQQTFLLMQHIYEKLGGLS